MAQLRTEANADTVEAADSCRDGWAGVVACGTYELDEKSGRRQGGIYVSSVASSADGASFESAQLTALPSGVLDIRWAPDGLAGGAEGRADSLLCVCACADTSLTAVRVTREAGCGEGASDGWRFSCGVASRAVVLDPLPKDVIGVALDLAPDRTSLAAMCCSDGTVATLRDLQTLDRSWTAHEAEVWSVALDPHSGDGAQLLATGADDCCLALWDLREPLHIKSPAAANRRSHSAGVTVVSFPPRSWGPHAHTLFTGSYDERVRVFDKRQLGRPLSEFKCAGGVWRLKWHPELHGEALGQRLMVAACHGGCELWELTGGAHAPWQLVGSHRAHESMAYGVTATKSLGRVLYSSCSFYDRSWHLWPGPPLP